MQSSAHTNFSVTFALALKEDTEAYTWIAKQLQETATKARVHEPLTIITDFDQALKNALSVIFPHSQQQICTWHILKNVILNIKKKWVGTLEGCDIMGDKTDKDGRRNATAAIDAQEYVQPLSDEAQDIEDEDNPQQQQIEAALEDAMASASQAIDMEFSPRRPYPQTRRTFEATADGIRDAWLSVMRATTEQTFKDQWDILQAEFPEQQGKVRLPLIKFISKTY